MDTKFVDVEEMRKAVEEALTVKTGIRAGQWDPPIICYGVEV